VSSPVIERSRNASSPVIARNEAIQSQSSGGASQPSVIGRNEAIQSQSSSGGASSPVIARNEAIQSQSSSEVPAYYELRLYEADANRYDALFVAAHEWASKDRYEIGRDVLKMGTVGQAMQIWSKDFDIALCANEAVMEDGMAYIPLYIHTPVAEKEYHLKLQNTVKENEQLWLCRSGKPIQNLTAHPEYIIEGIGGTASEYSLRILSGPTSNKPLAAGDVYVYAESGAIVINGLQSGDEYRIFDISGRLFAQGKATGNRVRISVVAGSYAVQVNNSAYKVIVHF
jgi:hypothetical protein